jgi:hypothetical protein
LQNMPSHEELDALHQALKDVVMNPEFQSVVAEIQQLPASERSQAASTRLTPEALAARGIQIPEGFAITTQASQVPFASFAANMRSTRNGSGSEVCIINPFTGQKFCFVI